MKETENKPWAEFDFSQISLEEVINSIKNYLVINRVQVYHWFNIFDPLNSGSISKAQFIRGLSSMGVCSLGKLFLSKAETAVLCAAYEDPKLPGNVLWSKFANELYSVHLVRDLEKNPTKVVPPAEIYLTQPNQTADINRARTDQMIEIKYALKNIQEQINGRRLDLEPVFRDCDRGNRGYVTREQFRGCLGKVNIACTVEEMKILEALFTDVIGFNYNRLLNEIQPEEIPVPGYPKLSQRLWQIQQSSSSSEYKSAVSLEGVLFKIHTKVWKERIRVHDFLMDYDKPKNGRILKTHFRRALDVASLQLSESEMAILEDAYQFEGHPDYVDYYRFSDEIELAFTKKHLEKNPLITPIQFRSMHPTEVNKLDPEEEKIFLEGMKRMAIKVRREQTPLFLFFLAFDQLHVGHVTHSQFDRILANLNLLELFTPIELIMVHKKFSKDVKKFEMIHYFDFIIQICQLAGIDP